MGTPVGDDPSRQHRPDVGQGAQLVHRRPVELQRKPKDQPLPGREPAQPESAMGTDSKDLSFSDHAGVPSAAG